MFRYDKRSLHSMKDNFFSLVKENRDMPSWEIYGNKGRECNFEVNGRLSFVVLCLCSVGNSHLPAEYRKYIPENSFSHRNGNMCAK